jgi:hypothetical protein
MFALVVAKAIVSFIDDISRHPGVQTVAVQVVSIIIKMDNGCIG